MLSIRTLISSVIVIFTNFSLQAQEWQYDAGKTYFLGSNVSIGTASAPQKLMVVSGSGSAYLLNNNTGVGDLLGFSGVNGYNFTVNSYTPATGDLKTILGVNYSTDGGNGYTHYVRNGLKKSPLILMDADNGSLTLYGESGTGSNFRSPVLNHGITVAANGAVGIGTNDPQSKLSVEGNSLFLTGTHKMYINEGVNADLTMAGIRNNAGSMVLNAKSGSVLFLNRDTDAETKIQSTINGNTTEIAYFRRDGAVCIGTLNLPAPDAKLAVKGIIYSTKVKVTQTGWADYVFDRNYRLRPLSEVELFIQQNHHLPEVPSAAEVEKNGLDLGDNQAILLKKIEELTLYLIDQNKKIEKLTEENKKIELLQLEIEALKKNK